MLESVCSTWTTTIHPDSRRCSLVAACDPIQCTELRAADKIDEAVSNNGKNHLPLFVSLYGSLGWLMVDALCGTLTLPSGWWWAQAR